MIRTNHEIALVWRGLDPQLQRLWDQAGLFAFHCFWTKMTNLVLIATQVYPVSVHSLALPGSRGLS